MTDINRSWVQLPHPDNASANYLQVAARLVGSGVAVVFVDTDPDTVVIGPAGQVAIALDTGVAYQNTDGATAWALWTPGGGGGGVGPGTLNTLAKFTPDGTHVGDSSIIDDVNGVRATVGAGKDVTWLSDDGAGNSASVNVSEAGGLNLNVHGVGREANLYSADGSVSMQSDNSTATVRGTVVGVEATTGDATITAAANVVVDAAVNVGVNASDTLTLTGAGVGVRIAASAADVNISSITGVNIASNGALDLVGFFGGGPTAQPTITGSRIDGSALADLLTKLAAMGLVVDATTP